MRSFVRRFCLIGLAVVSCLGFMGWLQPVSAADLSWQAGSTLVLATTYRNPIDAKLETAFGQKIDVNNTNVLAFSQFKGLYPTIAGKVVQNAPYNSVEEVLQIDGLTDQQKRTLQDNLDNFTITDPDPSLVGGQDRYNPGVYRTFR
ncbi:MAG: photosystem II complex extrinsic protein PsbU [Acaryochloris sp. RU_4_1]|jgi:photosystem II PsbU protein|nr:photosystem II complex extrinsic protein PsbU [Acaryochloris sp. SU_5_25]NJM65655.1 photosystem II complex extrinsic protein PsbU [Acaryochloris sp. RU_4_1]NJN37749.1 photosystem II complex extrinsic protein PsbU [Acaryochloridaceae cyanobacterium CSU_3_4]NJR54576.1 photosystem II complex extrinsic protein PsbU [Acaryochloris sp. CRU_2_0]